VRPSPSPRDDRQAVLGERGLAHAHRAVWGAAITTYLIVFIGSIQAGAADLTALGRAAGFTLAVAIVGRIAVGLASQATQPVEKGPTAKPDGTLGSLADLLAPPNVTKPEDAANAA